MIIIFYLLIILLTFVVLAKVVDNFLIPAILMVKKRFKLSDDQAGTLISFVSSAPELSVGMIALAIGLKNGDTGTIAIAAGTVIGSALFSLLFIVGVSAYYSSKTLSWHSVSRDMVYYLFSVLILFLFLKDGKVRAIEGTFLILMYIAYALLVSRWHKIVKTKAPQNTEVNQQPKDDNIKKDLVTKFLSLFFTKLKPSSAGYLVTCNILVSILFIIGSSFFMVEYAVKLAHLTNVPDAIISLTILAAGTSIPDFLASVKSAKMGYGDTAISNAIGSNIFDILGNLGLTYTIGTIFSSGAVGVATDNLNSSIILLFASAAVLVFIFIAKKFNIGKPVSVVIASSYIAYVIYMILHATKVL